MSSNNVPEKVKKEEELYFPYLQTLKEIFDRWYVAEPYAYTREGLMRAPTSGITNTNLEITAHGEFSEQLKTNFD